MTDTEELRRKTEQHNKIYQRMQDIQALPEKEDRDWTAEERTNWDTANAEIDVVEADIERTQQSIKRGKFAAELDKVDYDTQIAARDVGGVETPEQSAQTRAQLHDVEYSKAFGIYMRGGLERLTMEQRQLMLSNHIDNAESRAQQTTSGMVGGYLIPPGYRQVIVETLKAYGGLLNHANVITTSTGNPLQWPTNDETGNVGAILAEGTTVTENAMAFGTRTLGAYMYTSRQVFASMQILQDSVFNLDEFIPRALGVRLGRIVASHMISGTGTGQPLGIATSPTVGATGTGVSAISYDNLIDLEHSLDPAYRAAECRFLLADATLATIRKIKDSMGRPIWLPVPTTGFPSTINGLPYTIDQGMALPGANNYSILFGDFRAGYIVRQVSDMQMVRFSERYMDALQIAFLAFMRLDARPDDPGAIRAFQHAAS